MKSVYITARGAISGFGAGEEALWRGLLSNQTALRTCTTHEGQPAILASVPDGALQPEADRDWTEALLMAALSQIRRSAAWPTVEPSRLGICIGTTQGPIRSWEQHQRAAAATPDQATAAQAAPDQAAPDQSSPASDISDPVLKVARATHAGGPVANPSMACASGTIAVGLGRDWIQTGLCDAVLAGGADTHSPFIHAGFSILRALDRGEARPFDRDRAGLCLGEGAGLVLLQAEEGQPAVRVMGYGTSSDAHHLTGPDPTGSGLARAINAALIDAGWKPDQLDFVSAHGTATVFNDLMESKALALSLGEGAAHIPVNSIKGAIGHTMAAAGALEVIMCARILEEGVIPPTANLRHQDPAIDLDVVRGAPRRVAVRRILSTSAGFGGINGAIVLGRPPL